MGQEPILQFLSPAVLRRFLIIPQYMLSDGYFTKHKPPTFPIGLNPRELRLGVRAGRFFALFPGNFAHAAKKLIFCCNNRGELR